jgi:hypothetical protein
MFLAFDLIRAVTGTLTILFSLILLYKKKNTRDQVVNSELPREAIKAPILHLITIFSNLPAITYLVIGLKRQSHEYTLEIYPGTDLRENIAWPGGPVGGQVNIQL